LWFYASKGTVFMVLSIVSLVLCVLPIYAFGSFVQIDSVKRRLNASCEYCTAAVYLLIAGVAVLALAQFAFDDGSNYIQAVIDGTDTIEGCSVADLGEIAKDYNEFFCKDGRLGSNVKSTTFITGGPKNEVGIGLTVGPVNDDNGNPVAIAMSFTRNPNPQSIIDSVAKIDLPVWKAGTNCNGHSGLCGRTEKKLQYTDRARSLAGELSLDSGLAVVDVSLDLAGIEKEGLGRFVAGIVLLVIGAPICIPLCVFRLALHFSKNPAAAPDAEQGQANVLGQGNS